MIVIVFLLALIPQVVFADVFSKSQDQGVLDNNLAKDYQNTYYRGSYDYNASAQKDSSPYQLKRTVNLGCNRYDFHESLKNLFTRPEFDDAELEILMQQLSASKLLVWQYSSPTLADLYKHLDTTGHLRLGIRYQQCEDLEKDVDDPTVKLRKQAVMDCIRRKEVGGSNMDDIDLAFKSCFDNMHDSGGLSTPYGSLEDPSDGRGYISGSVNVTDMVIDRVNKGVEDVSVIKQIIPRVIVTNNSVTVEGPLHKSRELIAQYRNDFLKTLSTIVSNYKSTQEIDKDNIPALSVFGVPLTEGQIKNIAMLDDTESLLAMNKISSGLAYLKTIDQYVQASQMLDRVMSHPAIEPGYKALLKTGVDYVQKEIITLKEERERLSQYADTMRSVLDEADKKRMKAIALIKEESISQAEKGVLKLNP